MTVLEKINNPADVKKLSVSEMETLSTEIREGILNRVDHVGGHIGSDLGIVEATIALHYVFNSPIDKIVFDVSHQCYPHKMLTGRKQGFINNETLLSVSGFTNQDESEHDFFKVGHTSTSVSLATGLAKARDLKGEKSNIIALIGDGSLSGGEAYEGLNNAATLNGNFIAIVNDNDMCIAENHGGLYQNLELLRKSNGTAELNFFKALGFEYLYVEQGNNVKALIEAFENVKDTNHPVVVHIHTLKGKGFKAAEEKQELYHYGLSGILKNDGVSGLLSPKGSYSELVTDYLLEKIKKDKTIIAISPATPGVSGFTPEIREKFGANYTDTGIAEEHAVAFASGLAKNGAKPVLFVMSSFIQRAYDQLSQDLALNNSPATLVIEWGGINGSDATHLNIFDIPLISNIPNIVYLAPTNKEEYFAMLDWSIKQDKHPVAIRAPKNPIIYSGIKDETDYSVLNKYKIEAKGERVVVIALGSFFELGVEVKAKLEKEMGIKATLINPKFISGIDKELLEELKANHDIVITLEDGVLDGGFGEKITRFYGTSNMKVLNFGANKEFTDRVPLNILYERYHLTPDLIVSDIETCL